MKQSIWGLGALLGLGLLILDGKTAAAGAAAGVELCLKTVIPALFPFLVLSSLLTGNGSGFRVLSPLGRLFRIPQGAEALLLSGFLGGYPAGAQSVAQAYRNGQLEKHDAERLLGYCNNAGPGFLFGMAGAMFPEPWMAWALWGIHLASALLASRFLPAPSGRGTAAYHPITLDRAVKSSVGVMGVVCGWVVLFRVLIAFLNRWLFWALPQPIQVALTGLLELTNGCCCLNLIESIPLRFIICSGLLAIGGLCVTMQTVSVTAGLSLKLYIRGKLMQTGFSLLLCCCLFRGKASFLVTALVYLSVILVQKQKRGSNSIALGV